MHYSSIFVKSLQIVFVGLVLCVASAWAGPASIQGIVKDAKGQPIRGADVRVESRDGRKLLKTVKTDGNGRYISDGLSAGVYRVTLVLNGEVKASISNTKTMVDQPTQLNFDLKPVTRSQASAVAKSGKHMIWVPSSTGSHIGGRWVEVDDTGSAAVETLNVRKGTAEDAHQLQMQAQARGSGGQ